MTLTPQQKKLAAVGIPIVLAVIGLLIAKKSASTSSGNGSTTTAGAAGGGDDSGVDVGQLSDFESDVSDQLATLLNDQQGAAPTSVPSTGSPETEAQFFAWLATEPPDVATFFEQQASYSPAQQQADLGYFTWATANPAAAQQLADSASVGDGQAPVSRPLGSGPATAKAAS